MRAVMQNKTFPPEHSFLANSFQACVASILEKDIDEVPPFGESSQFDWDKWDKWLKENGLVSGTVSLNPKYVMLNPAFIEGYIIGYKIYVVDGKEKRGALIVEKGRVIHDPDDTKMPIEEMVPSGVFIGKLK